jgi:type I restriction enzyme, S subunit
MSLPKYSKYKDSGVPWLGKVPSHWNVKPLKWVSTCNDDTLDESTSPDFLMSYVEISGIEQFSGLKETLTVRFGDAPSRARRIVRDGDVLVSTVRTYLRAICPLVSPPDDLIASTGFAVVRPRDVNSSYLGYVMRAEFFIAGVIGHSVGVSYPAINASDLMRLTIPLPSEAEQSAIAAFLDHETGKIDALIAEQEKLITLLKEKRQAVISHAVTKGLNPNALMKDSGVQWIGKVPAHWDVMMFGKVVESIQTGPFGSQLHASDYVENGIPLINPAHIIQGQLVPDNKSSVDQATAIRLQQHQIRAGDIVMARRGEIGRCGVALDFQTGWVCGTGSLLIRLGRHNSNFFGRIISENGFKAFLELRAVGTTMLNLNPTIVGNMLVPVPPIEEQSAIVEFLTDIASKFDPLINKAQHAITLLRERRTALISAAVTGKIDVRAYKTPKEVA